MSGKTCNKCSKPYAGFGQTCSECRKTKNSSGSTAICSPSKQGSDKCVACGKTAYAMERIQVEGETFHPSCFRCKHCNNKLSTGAFSKSDAGHYYCKVHFQQLFKVRGSYALERASPTAPDVPRAAEAAPAGAASAPTETEGESMDKWGAGAGREGPKIVACTA